MSTAITVTVTGMTCGGCAGRVREGIGRLDGVTGVAVDLPTGRVTVDSAAPIDRATIAEAVGQAGYTVTG
ncbi:copper chaperone CopZ [Nocardia tenerifensis]|uniref:Copper chaperone CopZ n=1 Tax=Nocardia tenerifensis TaxID=228006 RepID=A0A318K2U4_9NOCA|nr:heavy metal-associated domain-containing protein [Nocardia tenerifensis]PXX63050.1 copper chaperone CopZ [Nocardia tenerifensis]